MGVQSSASGVEDEKNWSPPFGAEIYKWTSNIVQARFKPSPASRNSSAILKIIMRASITILLLLFIGQGMGLPLFERLDTAGLEVLRMATSVRVLETVMAVISVILVTGVYTLLIGRGTLMSTTSMYPTEPIEKNIGRILSAGWPERGEDPFSETGDNLEEKCAMDSSKQKTLPQNLIRIFYLGKMIADAGGTDAKGFYECEALPEGESIRRPLWLTSGSALNKNIVQVLVWEWVSTWLVLLMFFAVLLWNGFFTNQLNLDSYPRLTVMAMYITAYVAHFCYVWTVCSSFYTNVAGGAAWSSLEKAGFVVGDQRKIRRASTSTNFEFRSIDKANADHIPTTFRASLRRRGSSSSTSGISTATTLNLRRTSDRPTALQEIDEEHEDPRDIKSAISTLNSAQKEQRDVAQKASAKALDRVTANAMLMLGVTLSSGFSSWTSSQLTENSPNNTVTMQIGSLALLASLSLGAAAMFTSAMHLSIAESSFRDILKLKEIKINGQAVDHYKKREHTDAKVPLSFTKESIPLAQVTIGSLARAALQHGSFHGRLGRIISVIVFGPAYSLLPTKSDNELTSVGAKSEFAVNVRGHRVLLTTRRTNYHLKTRDGDNVDPVNVCYIAEPSEQKETSDGDENIC